MRSDESVDDSTVNPADFSVAGYTVTGITSGGADDNQLFLTLTELASPDTGATPDVTYTLGTLAFDAIDLAIAVDVACGASGEGRRGGVGRDGM